MFEHTRYRGIVLLLGCLVGSAASWVVASDMSATALPKVSAGRPVIAVDVDETLCVTDYNYVLWNLGSDNSTPLPGAQAVMRRLADSFDVVYVTARSRSMADKTQRWLDRFGFPKGRLVTSPTVGDFIFQTSFKRRVLSRLRSELPNLVVGIGDKPADAKAYRVNGIMPVVVNPWPGRKYQSEDVVLNDWAAVSAFFEANLDVLTDPSRVNVTSGRGSAWLSLPGRDGFRHGGS